LFLGLVIKGNQTPNSNPTKMTDLSKGFFWVTGGTVATKGI